jgi:Bacterial regulatory proteins, luxR family
MDRLLAPFRDRLLAAGNANREIAETLSISEGIVKIHVTHLFEKLGVTSRTALLRSGPRVSVCMGNFLQYSLCLGEHIAIVARRECVGGHTPR